MRTRNNTKVKKEESEPDIILITKLRKQQDSNWCYAAVIQMVVEYYTNTDISQETIVLKTTGDKTNNTQQDAAKFLSYNGYVPYINKKEQCYIKTTLPYNVIHEEMIKGNPILVRVGDSKSGHYVLVAGISKNKILIADPTMDGYSEVALADITKINTEFISPGGTTKTGPSAITGYCLTQILPPDERSLPLLSIPRPSSRHSNSPNPRKRPKQPHSVNKKHKHNKMIGGTRRRKNK
jgi:predicted double-glycine peptidase